MKATIRKTVSSFLSLMILLCCTGLIYSLISFKPYSSPIDLKGEPVQSGDPALLQAPSGSTGNPVRLLFAGDVMQHRSQADDSFPGCYSRISPLIDSANLAFANLEFPVDPGRPVGPPYRSVQFNGSQEHVEALIESGFRILITANNHAFDQGIEGLSSTLDVVRNAGGIPVGTAEDLSEVNRTILPGTSRVRVYLAAYTFDINPIQGPDGDVVYPPRDLPVKVVNFSDWKSVWREQGMNQFRSDIEYAHTEGFNYFVAFCHWGEEWSFEPDRNQTEAAHDLIDSGFDLVVGSHSHVLQGWEIYKGKLISYGLGNLLSDFRPWQVRTGALLEVEVSDDASPQTTGFSYIPIFTEPENHIVTVLSENESGERKQARSLSERVLGTAVRQTDTDSRTHY